MTVHTITFVRPAPLLSMNDRSHWRDRSRHVRAWRRLTMHHTLVQIAGITPERADGLEYRLYTLRQPLPPDVVHQLPPSWVTITLPVSDNRRRDPHNYFATVKPIVDGLVDAGLWPDDTPAWVTTTEPHLEVAPTPHRVTITITERT